MVDQKGPSAHFRPRGIVISEEARNACIDRAIGHSQADALRPETDVPASKKVRLEFDMINDSAYRTVTITYLGNPQDDPLPRETLLERTYAWDGSIVEGSD